MRCYMELSVIHNSVLVISSEPLFSMFCGGNVGVPATYNRANGISSAPIMNQNAVLGPNFNGKPIVWLIFQLCMTYFGVLHAYKPL